MCDFSGLKFFFLSGAFDEFSWNHIEWSISTLSATAWTRWMSYNGLIVCAVGLRVILCGHSVSMLPGSLHNNQQLSIWLLENMWQNMCEKYVACHALCCPSQYHNFGFNTNLRRHFFLILLLFQGATNICNNPWDLKWFEILPWITWWRWKYCHPDICTVVAD